MPGCQGAGIGFGWLKKWGWTRIESSDRVIPRCSLCTTFSPNPMPAAAAAVHIPMLDELQATLEREIPMSAQMGIRVHEGGLDGLVMRMPLQPESQPSANGVCGQPERAVHDCRLGVRVSAAARSSDRSGSIVIHRSTIKYMEPVTSSEILCPLPAGDADGVAVLPRDARRQGPDKARPGRRNRRQDGAGGFVQGLVRGAAERHFRIELSLPVWHLQHRRRCFGIANVAAANLTLA